MEILIARIEGDTLYIIVFVVNYVAIFTTLAAMMIAGFARSTQDGAIQLYIGLIVAFIIYTFVVCDTKGKRFQDLRSLRFYQKYCDANGRLKGEYLKRVYAKKG